MSRDRPWRTKRQFLRSHISHICDSTVYMSSEYPSAPRPTFAAKVSVKSVAESLIRKYNITNSLNRPMDDVSVHQEMMISCNGPDLAQCDSVVKHGLDMYFTDHNQQQNGKWHFLTQQKTFGKNQRAKQ